MLWNKNENYEERQARHKRVYKKTSSLRNKIEEMKMDQFQVKDIPIVLKILSVENFNDSFCDEPENEKKIDTLAQKLGLMI